MANQATAQRPAAASQTINRAPAKPEQPDGKMILNEILEGRSTSYIPLAESREITLTIPLVKQHLSQPTKSGKPPTDSDCVKYIMMCMQRGLNPWVGDCYLLGYDQKSQIWENNQKKEVWLPKFSMVVSIQALLKRAEIARTAEGATAFDGIESGVIVLRIVPGSQSGEQEIVERPGDLVLSGETLVGGWAKAYRKDRRLPFYQRLKLETYSRDTAIWKKDAAGMLVKCSECGSLRQAFPSDVGGLFLDEEIKAFAESAAREPRAANTEGAVDLDVLTGKKAPEGKSEPAPAGAAANGSEQDASQQDEGSAETSQETGQPGESEGTQEAASDKPLEEHMANWLFDVDQSNTNGALDQLAEQAGRDCPAQIRDRVLKAITDRRQAIRNLHGGKKNGGSLPGIG